MSTRPKNPSGNLKESGNDRHSKGKQESGLSTCNSTKSEKDRHSRGKQESDSSTCPQRPKVERSNAGYSDVNGKVQRKVQKPCTNMDNSASIIHGADNSIQARTSTETFGKTYGKRGAKNKNEETLNQTANATIHTLKDTTPKNCRRSKSVEQNDLKTSPQFNGSTVTPNAKELSYITDKMQHVSISNGHCPPKVPKETDSKQGRRSTQPDLAINLDKTSCKKSPAEQRSSDNKGEYCTVSSGARRRNSRINENEDTANLASDRGEIKRQPSRNDSLPNSNLSKHLKDAVKGLKMKMVHISKAAEKVNKVIDIIIKSEITKSNPLFRSMEKMSTGSYYEGVKISNPNEFDIMLKIEFKSYQTIDLTSVDESGAFYMLAFKKRKPAAMALYMDEDGNILAKYILDEFRDLVSNILQQAGRPASLVKKDPSSPAVTLTIPNEPEDISVDLVLALCVQQWPKEANNGLNIDSWLGTKEKQKLRMKPCYMVAKQANPGKKYNKDTWRISFSNIEKDIMSHHGSDKKCCEQEGAMCCRKQCLKLMKYILDQLKKSENKKMNQFCSYHAKTALLHACTLYPEDENWRLQDLDICFNRYVDYFQECLKKCSLPNFFIPTHNLFSSDYINKSSCNYLFEELEKQKTQNYPIFLSTIC